MDGPGSGRGTRAALRVWMRRALAILGLAAVAMSSDLVLRGGDAPAVIAPTVAPAPPKVTLAPPGPIAPLPIAGWVIDGDGVPVPDVAVSLAGAELARSEADGAFRSDKLAAG